MEIAILGSKTLRIRGKQATLVVDPETGSKTMGSGDGVIGFTTKVDMSRVVVEGQRLAINGPGEYEVGGVKITGKRIGESLSYMLTVDGVHLLLTTGAMLKSLKDSMNECDIVIAQSTEAFEESTVTSFTPKVVVLYGSEAMSMAKRLGSEAPQASAKFQTTAEKLPAEMEVVVLQ